MSTDLLIGATIGVLGTLGGVILAQRLNDKRADRVARAAAYADFIVTMNAFVQRASNEARMTSTGDASAGVWERVVHLVGVASREGLEAAIAWRSTASNLWVAKAIHEEAEEGDKTRLAETWANLQAASAAEQAARAAFAAVRDREVR